MLMAQDPGNGNTAIHIAAQNGHMEMLQLVMGAGADVNKQNKGGQTGLHMVCAMDIKRVCLLCVGGWCSCVCVRAWGGSKA